jgi:hypothetical protein
VPRPARPHAPARCAGLNVASKKEIRKGNEPSKGKSAKQKTNIDSPSTCFFSTSRVRCSASTAC